MREQHNRGDENREWRKEREGWGNRRKNEKQIPRRYAPRDDSIRTVMKRKPSLTVFARDELLNREKRIGEIPRSRCSLGMTMLVASSLQGDEFAY